MSPEPVELTGRRVRLVPMTPDHVDPLYAAVGEPDLWVHGPAPMASRADMAAFVRGMLERVATGTTIAWVTVERGSGAVIGTSTLFDWSTADRHGEIGATRLARRAWGSGANPEAKLLQLTYCFERLGALRIEFKADARNTRSLAALEKIGATREGVFRRHMVCADGHVRDSVFYAVTDLDWPAVRTRLLTLVGGAG